MQSQARISFFSAIIININIMLGAGLFINSALIAHRAGALGFVGYALSGILLFPLIWCIAQLVKWYPQGSFYGYGASAFSPLVGFISSWSYFTAKLASAGVTLHTATLLLQHLIPILSTIPSLVIDVTLLSFFIALNMRNVKTGASIQLFFMTTKLIPLLLIIFGGLWFFHGTYFTPEHLSWIGIPSILPLVLYATVGFEAAASLSASLENPEKDGPRTIIISYSIVIALACLYQALFYATLGNELSMLTDFRVAFKTFFAYSCGSASLGSLLTTISYLAIASSALGGCYGILFSNHWNLYNLARHRHIPGWQFFEQRNIQGIPWLCVLAEGFFCILYLIITGGTLVLLQQLSGLGVVITYTISVLAFMQTKRRNRSIATPWIIILLGLINCLILTILCIRGLMHDGQYTLVAFSIILTTGLGMFWMTKKQ